MRNIKFHPFFIIYVFLCVYFGWFNSIFFYVVSVVLHEYGHMFVANLLGYETNGILFNLYGAGLKTQNIYKSRDDIMISLAGPVVNIVLIVFIICMWWIFPTTYIFTHEFVKANLFVLIFNILPIYPLDGGRVLFVLLKNKFSKRRLVFFNKLICLSIGILFIALFVISVFVHLNLNLLFIGLFMTINCMVCDKNIIYEKIDALNKKYDKPCEVKIFRVESFDLNTLLKYIKPTHFSIFIKYDTKEKVILTEDDILNNKVYK